MIVLHKFTSSINIIYRIFVGKKSLYNFTSIFISFSFLDAAVDVANIVVVCGKIVQRGTEATSETIEYTGVFADRRQKSFHGLQTVTRKSCFQRT